MILEMSSYYSRYRKSSLHSFVKYGLVGVLGLLVDVGLFYLLHKIVGVNYVLANVISSSVAVIHNFFLNSFFTFKVTDQRWKRFLSFYLVALIGMGISSLMLILMVSVWHMDAVVSKVITIFFVAVIQFFVNKRITFRQEHSE